MLMIHTMPVPLNLCTKNPSPENMALLSPWPFISLTTPCVAAMKASRPMLHCSWPVSRMLVISPSAFGASINSPGPVKVEWAISPLSSSFFTLNFTAPLRVMVGDMATMRPGLTVSGQPMASWMVTMVLVSRCETR